MAGNPKYHEILADPENLVCTCPQTGCEWHGKCMECAAIHRFYASTPNCFTIAAKNKQT